VLSAIAALAVIWEGPGGYFSHLFLHVGPSLLGENLYRGALTTLALTLLVTAVLHATLSIRAWRRRQNG